MTASEPGRFSQWRDTSTLDEAAARDLVARLELRARSADEASARAEYLALLAPRRGDRALDVGCGSGVVARDLARLVAPGGRVTALDASPALLAAAAELVNDPDVRDAIEWRRGDCRAMPFDDASFDIVIAATVLVHVPDVDRAITEMVRVTRPGGRIGVFDFDGDSFVIAHPDQELTRRIVVATSDHNAVNGWLVRRLAGTFEALGLEDVRVKAFMPLERDAGGFYAKLPERAAATAEKVGAITSDERARWIAALHAEQERGRYLGGRLHIFTWGRRRHA